MSEASSLIFYVASFLTCSILLCVGSKPKHIFLRILGLGIITLIAAIRVHVGTDYSNYVTSYELINNISLGEFISQFGDQFEIGTYIIAKIASLSSFPIQIFFGLFSFFTLLFTYLAAKKYAKNKTQLWLFLLLYLMIVFPISFNAMRQMLAISIFFYATTFIQQRKLWSYTLYIILATLFHKSAVLLMPIYIIGRGIGHNINIPTRKYILLIYSLALLVVLMPFVITALFASGLVDKYDRYIQGGSSSTGTLLIIKSLVLLGILSLYRYIKKYEYFGFCLVMSLIEIIILITAKSSVDMSRFALYFTMFPLLMLSFIPTIFNRHGRLAAIVGVACYALLMFYQLYYVSGGSEIFPYKYSITGNAL